jgi:hypothetical protein
MSDHKKYEISFSLHCARLIFEKVPEFSPEIRSQSCQEQLDDLAFGIMRNLSEENRFRFFQKIDAKFLCHPEAENVLTAAVVECPEWAAEYFDQYKQAPYVIRVMRKFVPKLDTSRVENMLAVPGLSTEVITFLRRELQAKKEKEELLRNQLARQDDFIHKDPRLARWAEYQSRWLDKWTQNLGVIPPVKLRAIITRNLHELKETPSEQTVDTAVKNLIEQREGIQNLNLFKDRNVLFAANSEKWILNGDGKFENRFGKEAALDSIKSQGGNLQLIRGGSEKATDDTLKKSKVSY